jgi:hypothetical protein
VVFEKVNAMPPAIPIPLALDYTVTYKGTTLRLVRCEHCSSVYGYRVEVVATASDTSLLFLDNEGAQQRASAQAEEEVRRKLADAFAAVPCPECGSYQRHMFPFVQQSYRRWMRVAGLLLLFLVCPALLIVAYVYDHNPYTPADSLAWLWLYLSGGLAGFGGLGLIVARIKLSEQFDPNTGPAETRRKIGAALAISGDQLRDLQKPVPAE